MKILEWLLHERVILLVGAFGFAGIVLMLIHWNAPASEIAGFSSIMGGFAGALLRGITGHAGNGTTS